MKDPSHHGLPMVETRLSAGFLDKGKHVAEKAFGKGSASDPSSRVINHGAHALARILSKTHHNDASRPIQAQQKLQASPCGKA